MNTTSDFPLPADLPAPVDDGAAAHLAGAQMPSVTLPATDGSQVDLARIKGRWVLYIYPLTGRPGTPLPDGWDGIPGARGCTPQACSFRDHHAELGALNTAVYGLSSQDSAYQSEAQARLQLPFALLSDSRFALRDALQLPTFHTAGMELYKRLTLIIRDGRIEKVFYPVFPPQHNAAAVLAWLQGADAAASPLA